MRLRNALFIASEPCSVCNVFQWEKIVPVWFRAVRSSLLRAQCISMENLERAVRNVLGENLEKRNLRTINDISF